MCIGASLVEESQYTFKMIQDGFTGGMEVIYFSFLGLPDSVLEL